MGFLQRLFGRKDELRDRAKVKSDRAAIELQFQYCPQCGEEYRPEITVCAHCRVPLISGADKLAAAQDAEHKKKQRSRPITGSEILSVLQRGKLRDLKNIQLVLQEKMIASRLSAEASGCSQG